MRKKIVKVTPYSPNVEKVIYADGTWGLRGAGTGYSVDKLIPSQGRAGKVLAPQNSKDGSSAVSADEFEKIMDAVRSHSEENSLEFDLSEFFPELIEEAPKGNFELENYLSPENKKGN